MRLVPTAESHGNIEFLTHHPQSTGLDFWEPIASNRARRETSISGLGPVNYRPRRLRGQMARTTFTLPLRRPKICALRGARSRKNTTHEVKTATPRAPLRMSPVASCAVPWPTLVRSLLLRSWQARSLRVLYALFFFTRNFTRIYISTSRVLYFDPPPRLLPRLFFFLRAFF